MDPNPPCPSIRNPALVVKWHNSGLVNLRWVFDSPPRLHWVLTYLYPQFEPIESVALLLCFLYDQVDARQAQLFYEVR